MNNKKGYTLVELLAVVAIMAIILLIAIPNVMEGLNQGRKNTFGNNVVTIQSSARTMFNKDKGMGKVRYTIVDGKREAFYCQGLDSDENCKNKAEMSNESGLSYKVELDLEGKVKCLFVTNKRFYYLCTSEEECSKYDETKIVDITDNVEVPEGCGVSSSSIATPTEPDPEPDIDSYTDVGDPTKGSYYVVETGAYYSTFKDALNGVVSNQTLVVLNDTTETSTAVIDSSKKGVKLNLHGKKIYFSGGIEAYLKVEGELDIFNSSDTEANMVNDGNAPCFIDNSGKLTVSNTSSRGKVNFTSFNITFKNSTSNSEMSIKNSDVVCTKPGTTCIVNGNDAKMTVNNVDVSAHGSSDIAINNAGTLTIKDGNYYATGYNTIAIKNTKTITIIGGTYKSDGSTAIAISNVGNLIVKDANIETQGFNSKGISFTGGTIEITNSTILGGTVGVDITGNATISKTNINSNQAGGIGISCSSGTTTISDSQIRGEATGVNNSGTMRITNSTISSMSDKGINNNGTATLINTNIDTEGTAINNTQTLTIGENDGIVNTEVPTIYTKCTRVDCAGINNSGTVNYYDGVIKVENKHNRVIQGTRPNTPAGYSIKITSVDVQDTAILSNE